MNTVISDDDADDDGGGGGGGVVTFGYFPTITPPSTEQDLSCHSQVTLMEVVSG